MTDYQNNLSFHTSSANFSSNAAHNLKKSALIQQNGFSNDNYSQIAYSTFPSPYFSNDAQYFINQYQEYETEDCYRDSASSVMGCDTAEPSRLNMSLSSDENPRTSENFDAADIKVYPWMKKNHGCNDYGMINKKINNFF